MRDKLKDAQRIVLEDKIRSILEKKSSKIIRNMALAGGLGLAAVATETGQNIARKVVKRIRDIPRIEKEFTQRAMDAEKVHK